MAVLNSLYRKFVQSSIFSNHRTRDNYNWGLDVDPRGAATERLKWRKITPAMFQQVSNFWNAYVDYLKALSFKLN